MGSWEFESFRIGRLFHFNGNDFIKQSTRTARLLSNGRVFYFGKKELVTPITTRSMRGVVIPCLII
jgi:hypothetical protein